MLFKHVGDCDLVEVIELLRHKFGVASFDYGPRRGGCLRHGGVRGSVLKPLTAHQFGLETTVFPGKNKAWRRSRCWV